MSHSSNLRRSPNQWQQLIEAQAASGQTQVAFCVDQCVIGLDLHQGQITACAIGAQPDGEVTVEHHRFGTFKRDRQALADWVATMAPDQVVMESTGIYWKSLYAALDAVGIRALVVNSRHVKQVPGRKTDIGEASGWRCWPGRDYYTARSCRRPSFGNYA